MYSCLFVDLQLKLMPDMENVKAAINKRQIRGTVLYNVYIEIDGKYVQW
jgi:hypothetical protein